MLRYLIAFGSVSVLLTMGGVLFGGLYLAGAAAYAAEPPKQKEPDPVPPTWKKVAAAQFGWVDSVFVRDDYVVWTESKLDPATKFHRAPTSWYRLYRLKLREGEVESLDAQASTSPIVPAVGDAGVVAWETGYLKVRLYIPGRPTLDFTGKQPDHSTDIPRRIYRDALLCHTKSATEWGVTLIPTKEAQPQYEERQVIVPWEKARQVRIPGDEQKGHADFSGDFFCNGKYVAFTKQPLTKSNYPGDPLTVLWDVQAKKEVWVAPGWPLGMDADRVYACPGSWYYGFEEIWRRPIAGKGAGEKLALPWPVRAIVDFQPPKLQALFHRQKSSVLATVDLETGTVSEVAWELPSFRVGQFQGRRYVRLTEPARLSDGKQVYAVGGDTKAGVLVVATSEAIYRVPLRDDAGTTKVSLLWSPLDEKKRSEK